MKSCEAVCVYAVECKKAVGKAQLALKENSEQEAIARTVRKSAGESPGTIVDNEFDTIERDRADLLALELSGACFRANDIIESCGGRTIELRTMLNNFCRHASVLQELASRTETLAEMLDTETILRDNNL